MKDLNGNSTVVAPSQAALRVAVSRVSPLPETVDDVALLADPEAPDAPADGVGRLVNDSQLCQEMIRRGLDWSLRFTWKRTAEQTLQVYREAAGG